jgi:hypothetical protein
VTAVPGVVTPGIAATRVQRLTGRFVQEQLVVRFVARGETEHVFKRAGTRILGGWPTCRVTLA